MTSRPNKTAERVPVLSPVRRLELLFRRAISDAALQGLPAGHALATLASQERPDQRGSWSRAYVEVGNLIDEAARYSETIITSFEGSPHAKTFEALRSLYGQITF